ncbi:MAG: hypothetical protein IPL46_04010 [Saprospiraceae bacterium]|nr:hypothetical protein [Saprospiraceae bacterium]
MGPDKSITDLFHIFQIPNPNKWWQQVQKELGNQHNATDLEWLMDEGITIPPNPGMKSGYTPISWQPTFDWKIVEKYHEIPSLHQVEELQNYEVDELILHVSEVDQLKHLQNSWPESKSRISLEMPANLAPQATEIKLKGLDFVKFLPLSDQVVHLLSARSISYSWYYSDATLHSSPIQSLEQIFIQILKHLRHSDGYPAGGRIYLPIQDNYLTEIVKIRALKILLLNCWKACHLPFDTIPQIYGYLTSDPGADLPTNLIAATCRAMATVVGGVDALYFDLAPTVSYANEFRRLSRNIHYILKHESNLNHRIDPVCGSYNLEYMTETIASKVWHKMGGMDPERASV